MRFFSRLDDEQCERLHDATLRVLERTGLIVEEPEGLDLLRRAGANVDGDLVHIPADLVHWALAAGVLARDPSDSLYLYREDYATLGEEDVYNQKDAEGFIKLFGLPMKVAAMLDIDGSGRSKHVGPDYGTFKRD